MNLSHNLAHFKMLALKLNYTETAKALGMTQPPLTRSIQKLEEDIGFKLFKRDKRNVALTEAGAIFYEYVQKSEKMLKQGIEHSAAVNKGKVGVLKIACVGSAMQSVLPPRIKKLMQLYPDVSLRLYEQTSSQTMEQVLSGGADIGIIRGEISDERLYSKLIFSETYVLLTSRNKKIEDVSAIPDIVGKSPDFIIFERDHGERLFAGILQICDQIRIQPQIQHRANHMHSIIRLVELGLGISIVPKSAVKNLYFEGNVFELGEQYGKSALSIISSRQQRQLTKTVVELLEQE